jgi:hypothetical protein
MGERFLFDDRTELVGGLQCDMEKNSTDIHFYLSLEVFVFCLFVGRAYLLRSILECVSRTITNHRMCCGLVLNWVLPVWDKSVGFHHASW